MGAIKDGGPAFPAEGPAAGQFDNPGMTLRDYFAAKAMQAGIGRWGGSGDMHDEAGCTYSRLAQQAYAIADAMLATREGATP